MLTACMSPLRRRWRLASPCVRLLEQHLPAPEELGELVAGGAVRREDVHVRPVRRELPLELRDPGLGRGDRRLQPLELRGLPSLGALSTCAAWSPAARRPARARSARARGPPTTVVRAQSALLDRDDPVGHRVEQGTVVRDDENGPGKRLEAVSSASRLSRSRWFVGSSRTRKFAPGEQREREPPPLAAGECRDGALVRLPAREEEAPQEHLGLRSREPGRGCRAVEHRALRGQLDGVLGEVPGMTPCPSRASPRPADGRRAAPAGASSSRSRSGRRGRPSRRARRRAWRPRAELVACREADPLGEDDPPRPRRAEEVEAERAPLARERHSSSVARSAPARGARSA